MKQFIDCSDFSRSDFDTLFDLAEQLKQTDTQKPLQGKEVALIFEKPSLRTRVSF